MRQQRKKTRTVYASERQQRTMDKNKKENAILNFFNQPFLGWLVPSIIVSVLGAGLYKSCNNKIELKTRTAQIKNEINLRIKLSKRYYQICDSNIVKYWPERSKFDSFYIYAMSNLFESGPKSEYFDSCDYNQDLYKTNLVTLLYKCKNGSKLNGEIEFNIGNIKNIRNYYNVHGQSDSGSSKILLQLINDLRVIK
jgi:hypothetical protein